MEVIKKSVVRWLEFPVSTTMYYCHYCMIKRMKIKITQNKAYIGDS